MARWSLPLYEIDADAKQPPLGVVLPLEPHHSLFPKAWERVVSGQ
jgi:hypothetical protein